MNSIIDKLRNHGVAGSAVIVASQLKRGLQRRLDAWRFRSEPQYVNPTIEELLRIEADLKALGIAIEDYAPPDQFLKFKADY